MIAQHYLELFWQHRRLVIVIMLLTGGAAAVFSIYFLLTSPVYTAKASVTILPTQDELTFSRRFVREGSGAGDPSDVMMQTHIEYLLSRSAAELALKRLSEQEGAPPIIEPRAATSESGSVIYDQLRNVYRFIRYGTTEKPTQHRLAVQQIRNSIGVRVVEGSYILQIGASASSPKAAASIANTIAYAYAQQSRQVAREAAAAIVVNLKDQIAKYQNQLDPEALRDLRNRLVEFELWRSTTMDQVRVIDPAVPPVYPTFPQVVPTTVTGVIGGALTAVLLIIVVDTFAKTARTSMDMSRLVGRRYLGRVPRSLAAIASDPRSRIPVRRIASFTIAASARMGLFEAVGQHWVRVAGIGEPVAARKAGIAVAAAYANCGLSVELVFEDQRRYRIDRKGGTLGLEELPSDAPCSSTAVVTVGQFQDARPRLLTGTENSSSEAQVLEAAPEENGMAAEITHMPVILAVAVGQVHEDLLTMLALAGKQRLFVLVP